MLQILGKQVIEPPLVRPVVTLGTFDGVHRGHQQLLKELIDWARFINGCSVVITFKEHPRVVLSGEAPETITSLEHRLALFEALGVGACVVLQFNRRLAETTAEDFAREYFVEWLRAHGVLLGYDCRFGKGARGNVDLLCNIAKDLGVEVRACQQFQIGNIVPSSSAIREAIRSGDLQQAAEMLGRHVSILGKVIHGDGRGQDLGFPTANIRPHHEVMPPSGVYACMVELDGTEYQAVTNIGFRPTVARQAEISIETHIIDFSGTLYGHELEIKFVKKLRDERDFDSLDRLRQQILIDVQTARAILDAAS